MRPIPSDPADLLAVVARRLRRATDAALDPLGITEAQVRALRLIARATEPLTMGELADRLEVVPRTVTSTVDGLEQRGWVERRPHPTDRRATQLTVTDDGRALLETVRRVRRGVARDLLAPLGPAERDQLATLLGRLVSPA